MSIPTTPQEQPDTPEQDVQDAQPDIPETPAPRVPEHDELLRPNPPFPGDAADDDLPWSLR